ncbi:MAG TPA: multicopper oxidase family protein [Gaiellaceae bacterium]
MRHLVRALTILGVFVFLGLAGLLGKAWWDSRLPGTFDAMDMGVLDYGGGPPQNHARHPHLIVDRLAGPRNGEANVRRTLTAAKSEDAWAFDGRVPGPEIRVRQGDLVEVTLVNRDIDEGVTIHWHGVDVPNAEDGVAGVTQDAIMPGERHVYRFRAEQLGTFWYHSHQVSSKQVRRGLYGAFVIEPRTRQAPAGIDETLIVHDFDGKPSLNDEAGLVRRAVEPSTRVRLRLVNSNSSPEQVTLTGTRFSVVGIDGTEVNRPEPIEGRTIELGGGARYDLAFTMPEVAVRLDVVGGSAAYSFSADGRTDLQRPPELPVFDPSAYGEAKATIFDGADFDRTFEMRIGKKFGFFDGRPGRHWSVNGKIFPDTPMYVVSQGDLVKMRIDNESGAVHPMHLHGHHVLVLSRNGKPTTGSPWWVDTLNVGPDEEYEIAFRADNPGLWMDHCHNLPHAADGLTMHVMYEGVSTPFRIGDGENHPE